MWGGLPTITSWGKGEVEGEKGAVGKFDNLLKFFSGFTHAELWQTEEFNQAVIVSQQRRWQS